MNAAPQPEARPRMPGRLSRYAWWPIPLLMAVAAGLWVADLQTGYESRNLLLLLNVIFMWLASSCVGYVAARSFLASGQPGLVMLGCGSLLWGLASVAASALVDSSGNRAITVHNLGVLAAALCHLGGLLWRGRLPRPGLWLAAAYAGVLAAVALLVRAATAGWTPLFFAQGQGGTPVRQAVLLSAIALFAAAAWLLLTSNRRKSTAFFYWYGLGLALLATGLAGVLAQSVHGSLLGWTGRITQYLGGVYLFLAALAAARETGAWEISLAGLAEVRREGELVPGFRRQSPLSLAARYGLAVVAVLAAYAFRSALTAWVGPGLPTYITFYPAVMVAALLAGVGPGLAATGLTGVAVAYWLLPPADLGISSPVDRLGLVIFAGMGVFMSVVAERYRRSRDQAAAYEREAALHENRARLATFAQATFEGIVESEAGRIVDCNEQLARMLGYSVAELRGREVAELIAPDDSDRVMASIRLGRESVIEHGAIRKDGSRIIVEAHGRPIAPGSTVRHTALRDITERKQAEEALRQSEALYRGIGESIDYGVWVCAPDGRNTYASESFLKLVGLTQEQCSNFGWGDVLHPDDAERTIAAWQECVRTGGNWDIEHRFRGVDGQWHHVLARGVPIKNDEGGVVSWAGINLDITERKRMEERLQESERRERERAEQLHELSLRLSYHVDHSPLGVIEWGPDMRLSRWSGEAECIFGWKAEEVLGKKMEEFRWIYEEDEAQVEEVSTELLSGSNVRRFSANRNYCKDGSVAHCEWYNSSLLDESGQLRSILSLVLDVTERKRAEEELVRAKVAADAAARAKAEFLANMSHEIRTPMNAVIGFTDLLLGTPLDADQRRFLDLIKNSGEALLDVVNDVLDLSKMEAGRFDFVEEAFDLRDVTEKVTRSLGLRAHQKGLELTGHVPFSVPTALVGDPARLRQVLVNLLGNAIKFTEQGEVHLSVGLADAEAGKLECSEAGTRQEAAGAEPPGLPASQLASSTVELRFTVRDTGIGIPREKVGLLFQSFQQVDSSSTRRHEGTGLGLFISRRIVEQMGGRIEVESPAPAPSGGRRDFRGPGGPSAVEPQGRGESGPPPGGHPVGPGSTFSFTVPFRLQPGAAVGTAEVEDLRGHKVLVVDDNATNRMIVLEMLTTQGMAVALASGGEEALGLLRAAEAAGQPYELLLVDCRMPRMDGFQLIERVKGDSRFPQPAIIMITSDDLPAYSARARAAGAAAYLVKPVVCVELLSAVRSVLLGAGVQQDAPTKVKLPLVTGGRSLRLLLAEDNTVNQLLVRALVEREGWSIDVVDDGRAAVCALSGEQSYDLVLMDVQMPVLDGYEATKSLRELEKHGKKARRTPVIGLTARALPGDRQRCLDAGMDDYLPKPLDPQALYDVVRRHVRGNETREPAAKLPASLLKNPAVRGKVIGQLLTDLPHSIAALRDAVDRGSAGDIEARAHRLLGSLLVFGADDSAEAARRLEACGREERLDEAAAILETLEEELRRLAAYLEELRDS